VIYINLRFRENGRIINPKSRFDGMMMNIFHLQATAFACIGSVVSFLKVYFFWAYSGSPQTTPNILVLTF